MNLRTIKIFSVKIILNFLPIGATGSELLCLLRSVATTSRDSGPTQQHSDASTSDNEKIRTLTSYSSPENNDYYVMKNIPLPDVFDLDINNQSLDSEVRYRKLKKFLLYIANIDPRSEEMEDLLPMGYKILTNDPEPCKPPTLVTRYRMRQTIAMVKAANEHGMMREIFNRDSPGSDSDDDTSFFSINLKKKPLNRNEFGVKIEKYAEELNRGALAENQTDSNGPSENTFWNKIPFFNAYQDKSSGLKGNNEDSQCVIS